MRNGTGSQWRTSRRSGVTWSYFLLLQMSLAAALRTDWRAGEQAVVAVHPRGDKSGHSRLRGPKRQRLDAAPDETELTKATADRPRNMAPHRQVGLQKDAEIAHRGRGPYQGPQTLSSAVSRWIHLLQWLNCSSRGAGSLSLAT